MYETGRSRAAHLPLTRSIVKLLKCLRKIQMHSTTYKANFCYVWTYLKGNPASLWHICPVTHHPLNTLFIPAFFPRGFCEVLDGFSFYFHRNLPTHQLILSFTNLSARWSMKLCNLLCLYTLWHIFHGINHQTPRPRHWVPHYCIVLWFLLALPGVSARDPSSERRNYLGEKWPMNFAWKCPTST